MKARIKILIAVLVVSHTCVHAQTNANMEDILDFISTSKQGWSGMALPVIGYNSDLGFNIGASGEVFDYGRQPSIFPDYRHYMYAYATYYTGGQVDALFKYDSSYLIPKVRMSSMLQYQYTPLFPFYGINGDINEYHDELDRKDGQAWHSYQRHFVKFLNHFQGRIYGNINWIAGLNYYFSKNDTQNFGKYAGSPSLYDEYFTKGILTANDKEGNVLELIAGIGYDSRNNKLSPSKGIFAETYLNASPDIFGTGCKYLKLTAHFRHYFTPGPDWLTIAYHLAFQGCVAGNQPFYMLQNINAIDMTQICSDGLGGRSTLRGVLQGKLLGDGYLWGNLELRIRLLKWTYWHRHWYMAVNPLFDAGAIVMPYRAEEIEKAYGISHGELMHQTTLPHFSAGMGLKIGMDSNYILSLEVAKAFTQRDGPYGLSVSVNYIF